MSTPGIDPTVPPSGPGCVECLESDGWWVHLRRCAQCGHIGCCDSSPGQHATAHFNDSSHAIVQSYEPGEDWFWDYVANADIEGPDLAEPTSRPDDQRPPAPRENVPDNWRDLIHR